MSFLLQENGGYLLQENGGKIIIGEHFSPLPVILIFKLRKNITFYSKFFKLVL